MSPAGKRNAMRYPQALRTSGTANSEMNEPRVDRHVKHGEGIAAELQLAGPLLVVGHAHQRGEVGLDRSHAHRQQGERKQQARHAVETDDHVPQDVRQREADDRAVLAEKAIGQKPACQRQAVACAFEAIDPAAGGALRETEMLGHVKEQYRLHAVKGVVLGELAPEEEPDRRGMRGGGPRRPCRGGSSSAIVLAVDMIEGGLFSPP